ncbi:hypothetical protein HBI56_190280 [Parastagonospora nodorum]|uniref:Uncharacterized protein n=1 Tax=Phaeosphaeria nodorum (strain SN15 / ATCC MYA-4574 / FGSC 10173) TaxID=321614 RepID=A0A7U2I4J4_PHANO|nr:hypothetical protein HBH56_144170 [Parastagonospora nodorum]QRD01429.1 hypothetical protein JI435_416650 [Parastagonospora nodorum SN15]KAH3927781.1 hypothetical protein HBH54_149360 [Parastagonospora nodorum]KAH3947835.1 hypothetical protein HBH53_109400 [Parastagonospora nodorum]KAH3961994.1 hypothetical protein HBH51_178010 [Parastagonospora nodorum]
MEILDFAPESYNPPDSNNFSHHTSSTSHSPPLLPSPSIFPSTQQEYTHSAAYHDPYVQATPSSRNQQQYPA